MRIVIHLCICQLLSLNSLFSSTHTTPPQEEASCLFTTVLKEKKKIEITEEIHPMRPSKYWNAQDLYFFVSHPINKSNALFEYSSNFHSHKSDERSHKWSEINTNQPESIMQYTQRIKRVYWKKKLINHKNSLWRVDNLLPFEYCIWSSCCYFWSL